MNAYDGDRIFTRGVEQSRPERFNSQIHGEALPEEAAKDIDDRVIHWNIISWIACVIRVRGKMKYHHASPFGSAKHAATRLGYFGRVIISKLDRPVVSLRVNFVPFPTLKVHKSGFLP